MRRRSLAKALVVFADLLTISSSTDAIRVQITTNIRERFQIRNAHLITLDRHIWEFAIFFTAYFFLWLVIEVTSINTISKSEGFASIRFKFFVCLFVIYTMFTLYKAQEALEVERYRVRDTTPSKVIMPTICTGPAEVKEKENALNETGNTILNKKQGIKIYSCSSERGGV